MKENGIITEIIRARLYKKNLVLRPFINGKLVRIILVKTVMTNISCSFLVLVACLFIIQLSKHIKSCISQYLLFSFVYCKYCMLFIVHTKYCSHTFMYCKYILFSFNLVCTSIYFSFPFMLVFRKNGQDISFKRVKRKALTMQK